MCVDMPDLASCHYMVPRFSPSLPRHSSIVPIIVNITISVLAQKSTTTDRYWWSFGPAKLDATTAGFDAKTRRAISSSILAITCHIIHQNVDNGVLYHRVNRDVDMMPASYQNSVQNSGVLARQLVSWLEVGGVCCVRSRYVPYFRLRGFCTRPTSCRWMANLLNCRQVAVDGKSVELLIANFWVFLIGDQQFELSTDLGFAGTL